MDGLKSTLFLMLYGFKDCLRGIWCLKHFWLHSQKQKAQKTGTSKSLLGVLKQCITFSALFWVGIFIFNRYILNFCIHHLLNSLLGPEWQYLPLVSNILGLLFNAVWTLPLFCFSKVLLNFKWYNEIAELTFDNVGGKRSHTKLSYSWGDQLESAVVQCVFMLQAYAMLWLPFPLHIQHVLCHVHLSLLYALYSFEYKWFQMGWGLRRRLAYVNSKWPYFLGFGLPLVLVSSYVGNYIESVCLFSTLFPIYVVSSTVTMDSRVQHYSLPVKFFEPASLTVSCIFVFAFSLIHKRK
ncbi:etoposide-induced protein 2.4 homolog [Parasteatoda tepidariorum]|uniref:Etoposide-induced protein 2.4-like protein n=1 Tax=Parasteatoda tepidariorum TaxID=114398 RepID=A0A2L2Y9K0_PARTP|nr:etoposide-induced protein 2.4 homolog [Parasteatoda tepidariorum]